MSWTEREGPPVFAPKRRGFGTIVMETMTERSVDGSVDLDYAPQGVTWRLTCSAANALESGEGEDRSDSAIGKVEPSPNNSLEPEDAVHGGHATKAVADEYEKPTIEDMARALKRFPRYEIDDQPLTTSPKRSSAVVGDANARLHRN